MRRDTIFALASGAGRAGVAVIRISGPSAGPALDRIAGARPAPRLATLAPIRHPDTQTLLDRGLVLRSRRPSFDRLRMRVVE